MGAGLLNEISVQGLNILSIYGTFFGFSHDFHGFSEFQWFFLSFSSLFLGLSMVFPRFCWMFSADFPRGGLPGHSLLQSPVGFLWGGEGDSKVNSSQNQVEMMVCPKTYHFHLVLQTSGDLSCSAAQPYHLRPFIYLISCYFSRVLKQILDQKVMEMKKQGKLFGLPV